MGFKGHSHVVHRWDNSLRWKEIKKIWKLISINISSLLNGNGHRLSPTLHEATLHLGQSSPRFSSSFFDQPKYSTKICSNSTLYRLQLNKIQGLGVLFFLQFFVFSLIFVILLPFQPGQDKSAAQSSERTTPASSISSLGAETPYPPGKASRSGKTRSNDSDSESEAVGTPAAVPGPNTNGFSTKGSEDPELKEVMNKINSSFPADQQSKYFLSSPVFTNVKKTVSQPQTQT